MSRPKPKPLPSEITAHFPEGGLFRLLQIVVAMLLVARLLVPPEAAVFGETLWITQLWIGAVLLWGWDAFRRSDFRLQWSLMDTAVWIVVAGHGVSTLNVLRGTGDQRAALNLLWEWVGLGFSFFLLRQVLRFRQDGLRLTGVMLAAMVMLAGHGIWQHYVELPRITRDYERITQELEQLARTPSTTQAARLERELVEMGVPQNPVARSLWENRIQSTEPFATFALANTLAGFLAAWLLVAVDAIVFSTWRSRAGFRFSWRDAAHVASLLVVGYCLILTKSRTAWVGLMAGLLAWAAIRGADSLRFSRRGLLASAGLVLLGSGLFALAGLSGGFDREVISEAPKSLAYRWQYWVGSWEVVKEQPWLGTGPGNFRPHYLHHKLPESSEEIADPHNWVLDLWTSGGLLALLGFLALLAMAVRAGWRARGTTEETAPPEPASPRLSAWEWGAVLAFPVVLCARWASGEAFEASLMGLLAGGGVAWAILARNRSENLPWAGLLAGGLALLVHLLGAGGIEMPAIVQTLLLLAVFLSRANWDAKSKTSPAIPTTSQGVMAMSGLALVGFVSCLLTATLPVWYRTIHISNGDAALIQNYNPTLAAKWYEQASESDPYSPEPLERLAALHFERWRGSLSERDFEQAVHFGRLAIERDPVSNREYRQLGLWYFQRAESQDSSAEAQLAAEYLTQAVARYPHNAPLRAELALAYHRAEQPQSAADEAMRALELDQINRAAGHSDKFLSEDLLTTLEDLARSRD